MIYAAYKGEKPLIVDTLDKVAEYLGITEQSVRWYTYPASQKRSDGTDRIYIFKFKECGE